MNQPTLQAPFDLSPPRKSPAAHLSFDRRTANSEPNVYRTGGSSATEQPEKHVVETPRELIVSFVSDVLGADAHETWVGYVEICGQGDRIMLGRIYQERACPDLTHSMVCHFPSAMLAVPRAAKVVAGASAR